MDSDSPKHVIVTGEAVALAGGFGFFSFTDSPASQTAVCYFRGHRLFQEGRKVKPSEVKSHSRLKEFFEKRVRGASVGAAVTPLEETATFTTNEGEKISATFYSHCVWLDGVVPPEDELLPKRTTKKEGEEKCGESSASAMEVQSVASTLSALRRGKAAPDGGEEGHHAGGPEEVRDWEGIVVYRSLGCGGFVEFSKDGAVQHARFLCSNLFVDGRRAEKSEFLSWPRLRRVAVRFSAVKLPASLSHKCQVREEGAEQTRFTFEYEWRCYAVWSGSSPAQAASEQEVSALRASVETTMPAMPMQGDFRELAKNCEYLSGKVVQFLDKSTGLLSAKGPLETRYVIFKMQDLIVDGKPASGERLSAVVHLGDVLFSFCHPLVPSRTVGDIQVTQTAVQIWRGKRLQPEKNKQRQQQQHPSLRLPSPEEATHQDYSGVIVLLESGVGLAELTVESYGPEIAGTKVLFTKHRHFVERNGAGGGGTAPVDGVSSLADVLRVGTLANFDMIRADREEACGEYEWVAVLSWSGALKPSRDSLRLSKSDKPYRARLLALDSTGPSGARSGLLQVITGPDQNKTNQRVFFTGDQTYVFGVCMDKCDLRYLLRANDRLMVDLVPASEEERTSLSSAYGGDVQNLASRVWLGFAPKSDEDSSSQSLRKEIYPFLEKRGLDEEFFLRLVKGELPPKAIESQRPLLPPNVIQAKALELKPPKAKGQPTIHGIVVVENGPHQGKRAYFNRDCMWIHGHHMDKADLMRVVKAGDVFQVELAHSGGVGSNAAVSSNAPLDVVSMFVGSKTKTAEDDDLELARWLESHEMTREAFLRCVSGSLPLLPFFPLPLERQQARLAYFFPSPLALNGPVEYGILRIYQGSMAKKDVIFHRSSTYLWNVNLEKADLAHIFKQGERICCEVTETKRKDRKVWQERLSTQGIPKHVSVLSYVGGGRPKPAVLQKGTSLWELEANHNLTQWLNKRGLSLEFFHQVVEGRVAPAASVASLGGSGGSSGNSSKEASPLTRAPDLRGYPAESPAHHRPGPRDDPAGRDLAPRPVSLGRPVENPILQQARQILARVMSCASPEDPAAGTVVRSEADARLAQFIASTLQEAVNVFRGGGSNVTLDMDTNSGSGFPTPDGGGHLRQHVDFYDSTTPPDRLQGLEDPPQQPVRNLGPIGQERRQMRELARRHGQTEGEGGGRGAGGGSGLYGLDRPLLDALGTGEAASQQESIWFRPPARRASGEGVGEEGAGGLPLGEDGPPSKLWKKYDPMWRKRR